ncbi:glycoside hydrolase family 2 TIM barrel-domain containing protein [Paraflavitalea sp. CAU 1676]|uniref:glycoside hydrolase family 2 TIM barrel-domain containing protein n=1 Tax=Paraflavitalea sp. CAU 1676 TaxID=3032598 RepID=UPI0023DC17FB|nr:glycoside hydrolase family 2 TIM barrel-domain containing protein [Paraflavitalea sp. CAU 1676]MDF2189683.1 glycoside hydrolase family 2 TIM barrel-domain containing protein [Paraflavitalea sp. CAU 1676]
MKRAMGIWAGCSLALTTLGQPAPQTITAVKTELRKTTAGYQLLRGGQLYFVKGAGGSAYPARISAYGGNSIRTWGTRGAQQVLDTAAKYGLTVLLGLDVARERHGFNYDDTAAVKKQLDRLREEVLKYKDHPALLAWGIGNELNLQYKNTKVWDAVNDISKMIHSLDPNHPTTTVLAGVNKEVVDLLKAKTTDIDLLSVNTYGGLAGLPRTLRQSGWEGAYLVTEWGPTGHWEGLQTPWKSSIEETSSEKAAVYKSRYEYSVEQDRDKCLGSYVFLWGQKQERTPTWYGLFTDKGEESEVVDVMQYLWSGKWPDNKAPHLYSMQLDGKKALDNIYLKPGNSYAALAVSADPDKDKLNWRWEVVPEPTQLSEGGDFEARPKPVEGLIKTTGEGKVILSTPAKEGAYRLFVYITDGHNNVATANIPFYVKP